MPTNWTELIDSSASTSVAQAAADSAAEAAAQAASAALSATAASTSAANAQAAAAGITAGSTVTQAMIDSASASASQAATSASAASSSATDASSSALAAAAYAAGAAGSATSANSAAATASAQAALAGASATDAATSQTAAAATLLQVESMASLATNATSVLGTCGIMVPYYLYPNNPYSDGTFQSLISLVRAYRQVPVLVILNPGNGPGTVWDGNYAVAIRLLQGAGARVLGYVSTGYAGTIDPTRTEAAVQADIDAWLSIYAATRIDGVFLDEMNWETGPGNVGSNYVALYARYTTYCHDRNLYPVVGNPGTNQQEAWFATPTSDIIVVHENANWPPEADMYGNYSGGHANYPVRLRAALVYGQSTLSASLLRTLARYVNWVYVTHDVLTPNPWDSLATHLEEQFQVLAAPRGSVLPGEVRSFGGGAVPMGWLACDGAAVSRTTYGDLFAAIGTVWGAGDGSTTFNLPDLRGRTAVGAGTGPSLITRTLGQSGGSEALAYTPGPAGTDVPSATTVLATAAYEDPITFDAIPVKVYTDVGASGANMPPFAVVTAIIRT